MTIVDTVADRYYGDGKEGRIKMAFAFAELLNQEALRARRPTASTSSSSTSRRSTSTWPTPPSGASPRSSAPPQGLTCKTAVHICYGYGIKANVDWKADARRRVAPVRAGLPGARQEPHRPGLARVLPLARAARADAAARRQGRDGRRHRRRLRRDRDAGGDRRDDRHARCSYVPKERLFPCTNCGLAPMRREVAEAKLAALGAGRGAGARAPRRDERWRARGADDAARASSPRRCAAHGHAVLAPAGFARFACSRASPSSTRSGRRGTSCRPMRTCATAAATGAAATPASSSTARRSGWCRSARTGSRSNTTRCTAASSAGSSRSTPAVLAAPAWQRMLQCVRARWRRS